LIPDAGAVNVRGKTVVYLGIAAYPVKPVACQGQYYRRIANTNHLLSTQEVVNSYLNSVIPSWDFYINPDKTIADISLEKVNKQIEIINKRKQVPIENPLTFLRKYSLIDGEKITNACWLLFFPEQDFTTTIELGHFASETVIKDSVTLKSDLFTEVNEVMNFIRKHISKEIIITENPENIQRWEYPLDAIRELVLNMIVHRDYRLSYDSVIKIFKDRIQFYNPGTLPDSISIQHLLTDDYVSQPHNKQIAEIFKDAGLIEKYGSGIKRVRREFTEYGLPEPTFQKMPDGVLITAFGTNYKGYDVTDDIDDVTDVTDNNVTNVTDDVTNVTDNNVTTVTGNVTDNNVTNVTGNVTDVTDNNVTNVTDDVTDVTDNNVTDNVTDVTDNNVTDVTDDVTDVTDNNVTDVTDDVTDVTDDVTDVTDDITKRLQKILFLIFEDKQISTQKIAEKMNVTK
jgi:ATP-dependent DNA helicase RecG